jgi:hypothetical protein
MVKAQRDPEANQGRPADFQLCVEKWEAKSNGVEQ